MPESPEEIAAEQKLDEATREVAAQELDKETARTRGPFPGGRISPYFSRLAAFSPLTSLKPRYRYGGFRRVKGDPLPEPVDDPDPIDEHGLRDALHEHDPKQ